MTTWAGEAKYVAAVTEIAWGPLRAAQPTGTESAVVGAVRSEAGGLSTVRQRHRTT
jgi:hypothetical protein